METIENEVKEITLEEIQFLTLYREAPEHIKAAVSLFLEQQARSGESPALHS